MTPGQLKVKDPASVKIGQFDWDSYLDAGVELMTPTVVVAGPDALLTVASVALVSGNRKVNFKLSAGTLGATYTVTCQVTTVEAVPQIDERSFLVLIENL